ncbi:MAG: hypothetical protein K0R82_1647 [Flavipsychrobacter sp.]|nr:hypothetical protein [Flavipsychrobacter sp.]
MAGCKAIRMFKAKEDHLFLIAAKGVHLICLVTLVGNGLAYSIVAILRDCYACFLLLQGFYFSFGLITLFFPAAFNYSHGVAGGRGTKRICIHRTFPAVLFLAGGEQDGGEYYPGGVFH